MLTDSKQAGLSQVTVSILKWYLYNLEKLPEFENSLNKFFPLQHETGVKLPLGIKLKLRGFNLWQKWLNMLITMQTVIHLSKFPKVYNNILVAAVRGTL